MRLGKKSNENNFNRNSNSFCACSERGARRSWPARVVGPAGSQLPAGQAHHGRGRLLVYSVQLQGPPAAGPAGGDGALNPAAEIDLSTHGDHQPLSLSYPLTATRGLLSFRQIDPPVGGPGPLVVGWHASTSGKGPRPGLTWCVPVV